MRRGHLSETRELVEAFGAVPFETTVGRWSVEVHRAEGNLAQAEAEIQLLLDMDRELLDIEAEPIQHLWGHILAARGKLEEAVQVLQESLGRLEQDHVQYEIGCTLLELARVLAGVEGRTEEALAQAKRAHATFAGLGARLDLEEAEQLMAGLGE